MGQPESDPVWVSPPIPEQSFPQLIWLRMEKAAAVARIPWRNAPQGDYSLTLYKTDNYCYTRSNSGDANSTEELLRNQMHLSPRQSKSETVLAALYRRRKETALLLWTLERYQRQHAKAVSLHKCSQQGPATAA